jgi:RNA polymerase sigma-70 factor, ECF subfamily
MMNFNSTQPDPEHPCRVTPLRAQVDGQESATVDRSLRAQIETLIPRLRRYARAMARDPVAADDLVQSCLVRALGKIHQWEKGTDLRAWLFTILHNLHVSVVRQAARQRAGIEFRECNPGLALSPTQTVRLELRDLERAIAKLPEEQRSVILLVGLEGMSYDEAASIANVPVGTVRSRVSRGRETLRMMTELFPGRHTGRPVNAANLDTRRRQPPHGDHCGSRSPQMLQ